MTNYNGHIHIPCVIAVSTKHNASERTARNGLIQVALPSRAPCACIGCRYYVKLKNEGGYCCNSQAIWYLRRTRCRCDLKEPEECDDAALAQERTQERATEAPTCAVKNEEEKNNMIVYTVKDIQKILKISRTAAYALVEGKHFPVKRIGRSIRVSKEAFDKWMNE